MASAARRSSRRLLEPCSRTLAPAVTRPWPAVLFRTRLRPFHASPIRCALNIAQHDIFEAMGVRTDPSVARLVDRVTDDGFGVAGITVKGPVIVVGGKVFLWDVPQYGKGGPPTSEKEGERIEGAGLFEGWTAGMLQIFELLEQPPEILVFGTGAEFSPLPNLLRRKLHMLGIQTEVQKTVG
ncbi:hypothetical protein DFJ74DRAFT_643001 [Hyaloraphidium curvatum]|nr:hypothetical protein DFJ74DRAFT_643001 [Hyaloraphidium curvatum]